jgi:hypothetical protein
MVFIQCARCGTTLRTLASSAASLFDLSDPDLSEFHAAHGDCPLRYFVPTGRSSATGAWHEPLTERRIEVSGSDGLAIAIGTRRSLDESLAWRIEPGALDEEVAFELDREAFWATIDRAFYPHHIPMRSLAACVHQVENFVRAARAADLVLLCDVPGHPDVSRACFTVTARARLEGLLRGFGFEPEIENALAVAFDDAEFPQIVVTRREASRDCSQAALE